MRSNRARMSCSVLLSAWPMCSEPVTLGGGMTIENGRPSCFGRNAPSSSQRRYHFDSISPWVYAFGSSILFSFIRRLVVNDFYEVDRLGGVFFRSLDGCGYFRL